MKCTAEESKQIPGMLSSKKSKEIARDRHSWNSALVALGIFEAWLLELGLLTGA